MRSVAPVAAASRSMAASPRERRTCSASVMRATSPGVPARAKRRHQARLRSTKPVLVFSGWRRSSSIPGTLRISPGTDLGVTSEVAMRPALPNEQACPGASRSTSTTSKPRHRRRCAHAAPTMPAPMTTALARFDELVMERYAAALPHSEHAKKRRRFRGASRPAPFPTGVNRAPRPGPRGAAPSAAGGRCCRGTPAPCARRGRR